MRRITHLALLPAAVALSGCGSLHFPGGKLSPFDNFHVIAPGRAYRSAQLDTATLRNVIRSYGIRTVVNLREPDERDRRAAREQDVARQSGATVVDIPMSPTELPPRSSLLKLYDTFTTACHPILIHCRRGADRTGAASAIWRMTMRGDGRDEAGRELSARYGYLQSLRPEPRRLVEEYQPRREWIEHEYAP